MKKSLLALAVLGAFAGAASAQSSVTIYGKLDQAVGKNVGTKDKEVRDGSGSRIGFRGVEDLGGGLKALFQIEHRLSPDTGATTVSSTFWQGLSTVGLGGSFGTVNLGRQYTAAYSLAQNVIDPFGGDSLGNLRGYSLTGSVATLRGGATAATNFGGAGVNGGNTVRYDGKFGPVAVAADISEATGPDRPYSVAAQYAAGPLMVAASYENPTNANDDLITLGGSYTFGPAKVALGLGRGHNTADVTVKQALVGVTVKVGAAGSVLAGYAQHKVGSADTAKKISLGYRHDLSKRTQLYTDVTRVNDVIKTTEKTGYDFGIIHQF